MHVKVIPKKGVNRLISAATFPVYSCLPLRPVSDFPINLTTLELQILARCFSLRPKCWQAHNLRVGATCAGLCALEDLEDSHHQLSAKREHREQYIVIYSVYVYIYNYIMYIYIYDVYVCALVGMEYSCSIICTAPLLFRIPRPKYPTICPSTE